MTNAKTSAVAVPDPVIGVRANGDANDYSFVHGARWLMAILVNGEFPIGQQERMLSRMAAALEQELGLMERERTNAAAPEQPVADESFDEWYDRVYPMFWNNREACKAAFHAGIRSISTAQSSAGRRLLGKPGQWARQLLSRLLHRM